jgi:hypothetical protein
MGTHILYPDAEEACVVVVASSLLKLLGAGLEDPLQVGLASADAVLLHPLDVPGDIQEQS